MLSLCNTIFASPCINLKFGSNLEYLSEKSTNLFITETIIKNNLKKKNLPALRAHSHRHTAGHFQWDAIRERSVGLFLVVGCREWQCPLRRFHASVHSYLHSSQSRGVAIHTSFHIHGDKCVYSVPRTQLGINSFIGHLSGNWEDARL